MNSKCVEQRCGKHISTLCAIQCHKKLDSERVSGCSSDSSSIRISSSGRVILMIPAPCHVYVSSAAVVQLPRSDWGSDERQEQRGGQGWAGKVWDERGGAAEDPTTQGDWPVFIFVIFCTSRRRREMYIGHGRLSVCPSPLSRTTTRTRI